jgi:hypothetical protein
MRCLRELESVERGKEQGESRNGGPCRQVRRAPPNEALQLTESRKAEPGVADVTVNVKPPLPDEGWLNG